MNILRRFLGVAAFASAAALPLNAASACWDEQEVAAAQLRNFQSKLMVTMLRCQAAGIPVQNDYNAFAIANKQSILTANAKLKLQFEASHGPEGLANYDAFTTSLAGIYGVVETTPESCQASATVARRAASAAGDYSLLLKIADEEVLEPLSLPGGRCEKKPR